MKVGDVVWVATLARIPYQATITRDDGGYFQLDAMLYVPKYRCFVNKKDALLQYSCLCQDKAEELAKERQVWVDRAIRYADLAGYSSVRL